VGFGLGGHAGNLEFLESDPQVFEGAPESTDTNTGRRRPLPAQDLRGR